ncbi:phage major capsid protein [Micromonospora sp. WMMD1076]|uniref:phage major capsid protein n=1 Tax=Micromonospora sp. WMMD1076 TaxID=3016103 RepID=UPI00249A5173|nr:phage major capsid protein [Micromonospora sp. WMMD1076]WFF07247.1 phage major capsid protein [Micromonospora sp. WMMD1076]
MTLEEMIAAAREALRAAIATRATAQEQLMALRNDPNLTEEMVTERTRVRDEADAAIDTARADLERLEAEQAREAEVADLTSRTSPAAPRPTGGARVTSEPEVYRKGGQTSYFRDLARAQLSGKPDAIERLARNDRAMADSTEYRALTTTDGAGGDFVPPLWMVQDFIELARAGRVVADQVRSQPLPGGTDTISLPRLATGTAVAEQATQNTNVQSTDATTNSVSAAVTTIAGEQVVAQQLLDQSPVNMDEVLLGDLAADYAIKADVFVINNNATNKVGLLNVSGVNGVTYTDASPTPGELYAKVADAIQQIHTGRLMPGDKIFMHPRRWAWFLGALDGQGRPLITPDATNSIAQAGGVVSQGRVGVLQGLPVFVDPNIPTNLGAGTNEDRIIIARSSDVIFYEGAANAETFRETLARQLSVVLRFYRYAALHASRYPKAISVISGTGLAAPTF